MPRAGPAALSCQRVARRRFHAHGHLRVTPARGAGSYRPSKNQSRHGQARYYEALTWRLAEEMTAMRPAWAPSAASSGPASRTGVRPVTATAAARQAALTWPRLPAAAELAATGAGYAAYSLIRLAIRAGHQVAFTHATELWHAERRLHLTVEPYLNHLAATHTLLAEAAGYYDGLLHFLVTPLVLAWLYLAGLRRSLGCAQGWCWPLPPRPQGWSGTLAVRRWSCRDRRERHETRAAQEGRTSCRAADRSSRRPVGCRVRADRRRTRSRWRWSPGSRCCRSSAHRWPLWCITAHTDCWTASP